MTDLISALFYPTVAIAHIVWFWRNCPEAYDDNRLPIAIVGGLIWPVIFMFAIVNGYRALSVDADGVVMKGKP